MKPWIAIILSLGTIGLVAGAGYLGYRSSRSNNTPSIETPPTVAASICNVQQTITAPGTVVNSHQATLEMPADGRLAEISVLPGEAVKAGQVLARMDEREAFAEAVTSADLELLQAQKALEDLHQQAAEAAAQAQLELANAQDALDDAQRKRTAMDYPHSSDDLVIENAKTDYELAKQHYKETLHAYEVVEKRPLTNLTRVDRLKDLLAAKQSLEHMFATYNWYILKPSAIEAAQAEAELALAQASLTEKQANWVKARNGPDSLEVALAEAKVRDAQAKKDAAQELLQDIDIKAPFDGVVIEISLSTGESALKGAQVLVMEDTSAVEIEGTVLEEDFAYLKTGMRAELFFDALPEIQAKGTLTRIVPRRAPGERPLYYIYIELDEIPEDLVAGMTADTDIIIAERRAVLCLPRALVQASGDSSAQVDVWLGDHAEKRSVRVGLRGDTMVEILEGLNEGEQVLTR